MKVIYYKDELNDEFSSAKITPIDIDENYTYIHKNLFWNIGSYLLQNFISMPIKIGYAKMRLKIKYIGKEKLKPYRKQGYFVYVNHTQEFADTFIPSIPLYPKRNFFIVNPENVSMKGMKHLVQLLGAIPIPNKKGGMKKFFEVINKRIEQGYSITIYPEAHIWPFYTKIRPFKDVSFKYPVELDTPVFCMTNTYQKEKEGKFKMVTYIDGPFFVNKELTKQEQKKELRNNVYEKMVERSKMNNYEQVKYLKGGFGDADSIPISGIRGHPLMNKGCPQILKRGIESASPNPFKKMLTNWKNYDKISNCNPLSQGY